MASATRTHQTPPEPGASPNRPRVPEQVSQPESLKRLTMAAEGLVRQRRGRHGRAKKGLLCLPREGGRSNNTNHTSSTNLKTTISGGGTMGLCLHQPQSKHSDTRPHCTHCSPKRHTKAKHRMNDEQSTVRPARHSTVMGPMT